MPRITRKQQKVFAVDATNNGVFGSLQAQDPVHSQDPDVIQSRTAYSNGWNDATYSAEKLPPLEEFQALQYLFSRQIAYLMQEGISEWNSATTYYKGSLVKAIQNDGSFILYASLVDNNTNNQVTDTTKWIITNTSTNFHQGIPNWRADVVYSEGDWVKSYNESTGWMIYESTMNSNLNNVVTDTDYWSPKPFTSEFPLLMHSWFDHEVDDTSWLRADTYSWQDGTVYSRVYDHLVEDIDGETATTETIGSYTITYYLASDGHKIILPDQETTAVNIYNSTGSAWYYILDTDNTRFKLPRENPAREELIQTIRAKGNGKTIGFNNGSVNAGLFSSSAGTALRTNMYDIDVGTGSGGSNAAGGGWGLVTDSTKSGIISDMKESTSVYKGKKYLYFYVGQFSQSATEQTAGLNASLFNGKLDLDLGNISNVSKETIIGWLEPDWSAGVDIVVPVQATPYVCPSDGVYVADFMHSGGNNRTTYLYVNGVKTANCLSNSDSNNRNKSSISVRLKKDDSIYFEYGTTTSNTMSSAFYPLKGVTNA